MSMLRRAVPVLLGIGLLAACTPAQVGAWLNWHSQDPEAALAFANHLRSRSRVGQDGVVEPDAPEPDWHAGDTPDSPDPRRRWPLRLGHDRSVRARRELGINTGNGYSGGLQFLHSTWRAYGGQQFAVRWPTRRRRSEQIIVAERVLDDVGWGAWPTCSRRAGLR